AVQASIALPFVARPVHHGGSFYLDGGIIDTAPVGVARGMGADRVICICLGYNYIAPRFLRQRPWTRAVLERLGRQERAIAGKLRDQIRFSCRLYSSCYDPPIPAQDADLAIWPEFNGLNPNSIFGADFCYRQGRDAALAALPEIEGLLAHPQLAS
ncbi:MAG TPA: patatin-like phospholipase family protein, partial [Dongiaceae bacterium]